MDAELSPEAVEALHRRQMAEWPAARERYEALYGVRTRQVRVGPARFIVQHNPARIGSTAARVDSRQDQGGKCFLCAQNRPAEQRGIEWNGYDIEINPYPIFPRHLTIIARRHEPQSIMEHVGDMLRLAALLEGYTVFYNGPRCGASAPRHLHFQAVPSGKLPIEDEIASLAAQGGDGIWAAGLGRGTLVARSADVAVAERLATALLSALPVPQGDREPMVNALCWRRDGSGWTVAVLPRRKHRPDCYYATGEERVLVSPASVDLGGVLVAPLEKDFERIDAARIGSILAQVCLGDEQATELVSNLRIHI